MLVTMFYLSLVAATAFNISTYNPALKTGLACDQYSDCYNCTLSNCDWEGTKCNINPYRSVQLTWSTFIKKSFTCIDSKHFCTENMRDGVTTYGYATN